MDNQKRIVVTGIGPLACCGIGREKFWQGILDKKTNLQEESCVIDGQLWDKFWLHKLDGFNIHNFGVDEDKLQDIKDWKDGEEIIDLYYLIAAIKLALDDSKLDYQADNNETGLVLAHENLGLMPFAYKSSDLAYEMLIGKKRDQISKKDFFEGFYKKFLKSGYDIQTFADLFHIARVFNIHNYSLFINNACASGLYAFESAAQIIAGGQAKSVVVASADCPDIYKYIWFRDLGIYAKDGLIKPFSKNSNGLVFGDGGAAVVFEEFEHAQKRNAPIYAEYLGGGFDLEGWKITVPQLGSKSYQTAIKRAFDRAKIKTDEVDLLVPHGVGSQPIDYYESKAITDTFGLNPSKPYITAFKPLLGHNLGSSALLEATAMLLSLKNGLIPQTLNYIDPDPKFNIALVKEDKKTELKTAMKICGAFAGFNSAAIFRKL